MGIYSFYCPNCGNIDLELKMSQIPLDKCPICKSENVQRVFQSTNSVWKTSGAFSKKNHKE